jgi:hypothetical protein
MATMSIEDALAGATLNMRGRSARPLCGAHADDHIERGEDDQPEVRDRQKLLANGLDTVEIGLEVREEPALTEPADWEEEKTKH